MVNENSITRPLYKDLALNISFEWQSQFTIKTEDVANNNKKADDEDDIISAFNFKSFNADKEAISKEDEEEDVKLGNNNTEIEEELYNNKKRKKDDQ